MVISIVHVDETLTGLDSGAIRDGFTGQRMLVVPRQLVREALQRPVTGRLLVTDAGWFPHAARHGRARAQGAREHILLLCTEGAGWCRTHDSQFTVPPGAAALLPANLPHAYGASHASPWTLWWFHFTGADALELVRAARRAAGGPVTHLRDPAPVASLVSQVIDALDSGPTTAGFTRAAGAAWNALAQVIATGRRGAGRNLSPVERAVDHLRSTTPQRTSVTALASMVGLSTSQLSAQFRRQLGVSPLRYQTRLRMTRARELLDRTCLSVSAVAREAGYDDPTYFSRQFARIHGMSPTAYRDRGSMQTQVSLVGP
jgi:AraC-like DNA-binding protein